MFFATKTATRKRTIINASPITVPYKRSPTAHSSKTSWAPAGCPMGEPKRKQHLPGGTRMKRRTSLSLPFRSFLLALTCFFFRPTARKRVKNRKIPTSFLRVQCSPKASNARHSIATEQPEIFRNNILPEQLPFPISGYILSVFQRTHKDEKPRFSFSFRLLKLYLLLGPKRHRQYL